ncbi:hypothetical protein ACBR40_45725 [Nonomuraea sp. AD125B]|uniref:hypothetical protein n=1 Tax=Nonomuraea sp. AD125B TaxID=3242897 RepID=UPI003529A315
MTNDEVTGGDETFGDQVGVGCLVSVIATVLFSISRWLLQSVFHASALWVFIVIAIGTAAVIAKQVAGAGGNTHETKAAAALSAEFTAALLIFGLDLFAPHLTQWAGTGFAAGAVLILAAQAVVHTIIAAASTFRR